MGIFETIKSEGNKYAPKLTLIKVISEYVLQYNTLTRLLGHTMTTFCSVGPQSGLWRCNTHSSYDKYIQYNQGDKKFEVHQILRRSTKFCASPPNVLSRWTGCPPRSDPVLKFIECYWSTTFHFGPAIVFNWWIRCPATNQFFRPLLAFDKNSKVLLLWTSLWSISINIFLLLLERFNCLFYL